MKTKLSWEDIKKFYSNEWVELVDFDWSEFEQNPKSGTVRYHAKKRKDLHDLIVKNPTKSSAVLFVGDLQFPDGTVFSANLHQYQNSAKGELIVF